MTKKLITGAITAVLAAGLGSVSLSANAEEMEMANIKGMEKCYGVAKAGMNDCSTAGHHCAGESKLNGSKKEWLLTPAGLCNKLVGGSTQPENTTKKG